MMRRGALGASVSAVRAVGAASAALHASPASASSSSSWAFRAAPLVAPSAQRRTLFGFGESSQEKVKLDTAEYDKQNVHYTGSIFGVAVESLVHYGKIALTVAGILSIVYLFWKASFMLSQYSVIAVGKMGFVGGFITATGIWWVVNIVKRRYNIPPNAVYNQAIAIALRDKRVTSFLGSYPRTGEFRAYHASGGFKLPLPRRIRSGQYELADLIGTKPKKLQMIFLLISPDEKQALVSCEVRKADSAWVLGSSYYFHSLAVHLSDPKDKAAKESVILIGNDKDVVYPGIFTD
eukprot:CAMPEP_0174828146 /NCGR_PEP_ID=MMETSP1114-20130205/1164_1 /TAXON_ID=312471 /ORGANISM="Neobodo designis, Strain CCAP 1951/1" /LENGTH=292 /DNA_ID=CAMNT_0016061857 /DNA_START=50 /DNA_END=928 /DNA_ORIENTATION=-